MKSKTPSCHALLAVTTSSLPRTFALFLAISLSSLLLISACKTETEKCKFGDPTAIFSDTMKMVKKHHFEIKEKTGIELASFSNGMMLEVEQSGCNEVHQQFTFILPGDFSKSDDNFWKTLAVKNFRLLADSSPKLYPFNGWADAIDSVKDRLKLAEPVEVEKGTQVRIDKIVSDKQTMLVVQLSQAE